MALFHISLLGRFSLHLPGQPCINNLETRKVEELFFYLLCRRQQPHHREVLASLLWKENSNEQARRYLRKVLWQLQNTLQPDELVREQPLILVEPEWVQINPDADMWLDIAVLEDVFKSFHGTSGEDLSAAQLAELTTALDIWAGDLLEGWYQDWCLLERERLRFMYLALLDKIIRYCEAHRKYEEGIFYGQRILLKDRARESTHRSLMRLYYLAHNRTAALRQFHTCEGVLREELGVKPSQRTRVLYQQMREEQWAANTEMPAMEISILNQLGQLRTVLGGIQVQLDRMIAGIDQVGDRDGSRVVLWKK